jgi:hypothetical protein
MVSLSYRAENGGGSMGTDGRGEDGQKSPDTVGTELAQQVYARLFPDSGTTQLESVIADSRLTDGQRLDAIQALLRAAPRMRPDGTVTASGLSSNAVAAAIELGRATSSSPDTRRRVWEYLIQSDNPLAAQALIDALLYDDDARVRAAAADSLTNFIADDVVRSALESAVVSDNSGDVRVRARWAISTNEERLEFVDVTLRDANLTPEQRIGPLIRARASHPVLNATDLLAAEIPAVGAAALDAIAAIVQASDDERIRTAGLMELGLGGHEAFTTLLQAEPDAAIRRQIVGGLLNRRERPGVTEQIEQIAQIETDPAILATIETALSPLEFPFSLAAPPEANQQ